MALTSDDTVPRDFAALRALIGARAQTLPRRLTQVAAYALDNPDEIAVHVSASTHELTALVIQAARDLGSARVVLNLQAEPVHVRGDAPPN